jgi:hypothetical protein
MLFRTNACMRRRYFLTLRLSHSEFHEAELWSLKSQIFAQDYDHV